jgi:hypothetical protein
VRFLFGWPVALKQSKEQRPKRRFFIKKKILEGLNAKNTKS